MDRPLPCPFCGSHDVHVDGIGQQVVRCMTCRAEGPAMTPMDPQVRSAMRARMPVHAAIVLRDLAISAWNRAPRQVPLNGVTTSACAECGDEIAVEACSCDRRAEQDEHEAQYLEGRCACCEEIVPECSCDEPSVGAVA